MEVYQIRNEQFEVSITKAGAEISSFKSLSSHKEFMWQGNPEIWGSHAPVLFPIVGGLKNDTFIYNDKSYQLPRHGFVRRNSDLKLVSQSTHQLVLQLSSSTKTKKIYPFDFEFQISFELISNNLKVSHRVVNTGNDTMYFSLGAHPAFNCPLEEGKSYSDYHLSFNKTETLNTWELDGKGQIKTEGKQIMNNNTKIALHPQLFDKDALIFKSLKSRQISLCDQGKEHIRVSFEDFKSLGLWAKPGAPFVCIEPWLGYADASNSNQQIKEKEGINSLEPKKEFTAQYIIEVFD